MSGPASELAARAGEKLSSRVVVITGASAGVGLASARVLLTSGATVVATARRLELMEERLTDISSPELHLRRADVREPTEMAALAAEIDANFGRCDALICSAGIGEYATLVHTSEARIRDIVETNLLGTIWAVRAFLPMMTRAQRGDIVIVSSVAAILDSAGEAVYAATKAAQRSLAGCLDLELRRNGIRVTALCPGGIATEFAIGHGRDTDSPELQTMLTAEDVADAITTVLSARPHVRTHLWWLSHLCED